MLSSIQTLTRRARATHTTSGTDLDVEGGDAELFAASRDVLGSQHGGVGRRLVTVGLDLHTTGDTADGFAAAGITQNVSLGTKGVNDFDRRGVGRAKDPPLSPSVPNGRSYVQRLTNLRSVTWTKVSLKLAKMRATKRIRVSKTARRIQRGGISTYRQRRAHPPGPGAPGRCSPELDGRSSWGALW